MKNYRYFKKIIMYLVLVSMIFSGINYTVFAASPAIVSVNPGPDKVPVSSSINVQFDSNVSASTYFGGITIKDMIGNSISVYATINGNTLSIKPYSNLAKVTTYIVNIPVNAVKNSNNEGNNSYTYTFTTESDSNQVTILTNATSPINGASNIVQNPIITVPFSSTISQGDNFSSITLKDSTGKLIDSLVEIYSSTYIRITPKQNLDANTAYTVDIPIGCVRNSFNNANADEYSFSFTTTRETGHPTILSTTPNDGDTNIDVTKPFTVKFNEKVKRGDNFDLISLRDINGNGIPIIKTIKDDTLTLTPQSVPNFSTKYILTIPYGVVKDMSDNSLDNGKIINFITQKDNVPPQVISSYPVDKAKYVPIDKKIEIYFNENIQLSSDLKGIDFKDSKGSIPISPIVDHNRLSISLKDIVNMAPNSTYTLSIQGSAIKDIAGNAMKDTFTIGFTTEQQISNPRITAMQPYYGQQDFNVSSPIVATFSCAIVQGDNFNKIVLEDKDGNIVSTKPNIVANQLVISPSAALNYDLNYKVIIPEDAVRDLYGTRLKDRYEYAFKTDRERIPPRANFYPNNGAANVAVDGTIIASFNEKIQAGDYLNNISMYNSSGTSLAVTPTVKDNKLYIKLTNILNFAYGSSYRLEIPYGAVKDMAGNSSDYYVLNFTTGNQRFLPVVKTTLPLKDSTDFDVNGSIMIFFGDTVQQCEAFNNISLVDDKGNAVPMSLSVDNDKIIIKPLGKLLSNTRYNVNIPELAVKDQFGNPMETGYSFSFTTRKIEEAPVIVKSNINDGQKYVPIDTNIRLEFNQDLLNFNGIELSDGKTKLQVSILINGNVLTINPVDKLKLANGTKYTLTVPSGSIIGVYGNSLKDAYTLNFTTESSISKPKIKTITPSDGSKDISVGSKITVAFDDKIKKGDNFDGIQLKSEKGEKVSVSAYIKDNILTVSPYEHLKENTIYNLEIPNSSVQDISNYNAPLKESYTFTFKTEYEPKPPVIKKTYPSSGKSNIAVDSIIRVVFDNPVNKGNNFGSITIRDLYGNIVPVKGDIKGNAIIIKPDNNLNLNFNTNYSVVIPDGAVKSEAGIGNKGDYSFNFTTGKDKYLPVIKSTNPANNSTEISPSQTIEVVFSSNMVRGENFNDISLKDASGKNYALDENVINDKLYIIPKDKINYSTQYSLVIPEMALFDIWNNPLSDSYTLKFTTGKMADKGKPGNQTTRTEPLIVKSIAPSNGSKKIDINSQITIRFNRPVKLQNKKGLIQMIGRNRKAVSITYIVNGDTLIIKPDKELDCSIEYLVNIPKGAVQDNNGVLLSKSYSFKFTTLSVAELQQKIALLLDKTPPAFVTFNMDKNNKWMAFGFNENITLGKNAGNITVRYGNDSRNVSIKPTIKGNTLIIQINNNLYPNIQYNFYMPAGAIKDLAGNEFGTEIKFVIPTKK